MLQMLGFVARWMLLTMITCNMLILLMTPCFGQQDSLPQPSKSRKDDAWYLEQPLWPPMPYSFGYRVRDFQGNEQYRKESSDGQRITGSYGYYGPDGIFRHVDYIADEQGFRANVRTSEPGVVEKNPADVRYSVFPLAPGVPSLPGVPDSRVYPGSNSYSSLLPSSNPSRPLGSLPEYSTGSGGSNYSRSGRRRLSPPPYEDPGNLKFPGSFDSVDDRLGRGSGGRDRLQGADRLPLFDIPLDDDRTRGKTSPPSKTSGQTKGISINSRSPIDSRFRPQSRQIDEQVAQKELPGSVKSVSTGNHSSSSSGGLPPDGVKTKIMPNVRVYITKGPLLTPLSRPTSSSPPPPSPYPNDGSTKTSSLPDYQFSQAFYDSPGTKTSDSKTGHHQHPDQSGLKGSSHGSTKSTGSSTKSGHFPRQPVVSFGQRHIPLVSSSHTDADGQSILNGRNTDRERGDPFDVPSSRPRPSSSGQGSHYPRDSSIVQQQQQHQHNHQDNSESNHPNSGRHYSATTSKTGPPKNDDKDYGSSVSQYPVPVSDDRHHSTIGQRRQESNDDDLFGKSGGPSSPTHQTDRNNDNNQYSRKSINNFGPSDQQSISSSSLKFDDDHQSLQSVDSPDSDNHSKGKSDYTLFDTDNSRPPIDLFVKPITYLYTNRMVDIRDRLRLPDDTDDDRSSAPSPTISLPYVDIINGSDTISNSKHPSTHPSSIIHSNDTLAAISLPRSSPSYSNSSNTPTVGDIFNRRHGGSILFPSLERGSGFDSLPDVSSGDGLRNTTSQSSSNHVRRNVGTRETIGGGNENGNTSSILILNSKSRSNVTVKVTNEKDERESEKKADTEIVSKELPEKETKPGRRWFTLESRISNQIKEVASDKLS